MSLGWHVYPAGYRPVNFCRSCGCDFSSVSLFDDHRTGVHEYLYEEGLEHDPPVEDGRRCLTEEEMRARGWRPYTDGELLALVRHRSRAGLGVELWFDPARRDEARRAFPKSGASADSAPAEAPEEDDEG